MHLQSPVADTLFSEPENEKPRSGGRCGVLVFAWLSDSELATHSAPAPAADRQQQQSYGQQTIQELAIQLGAIQPWARIMGLPGPNSLLL
jgi:hypothetical protein